eukprot:SAG31_NODE_626_length_13460_cov_14.387517_13_plen_56_part_00
MRQRRHAVRNRSLLAVSTRALNTFLSVVAGPLSTSKISDVNPLAVVATMCESGAV